MKAALLSAPGVPVYADLPEPETTDPVIAVSLAAINPFDVGMSRLRKDFPVVPGFEGVGLYQGRRVYFRSGMNKHGAMAEKAAAKPEDIIDIPEGVSDEMAIALGTPGLTAYLTLTHGAALQPGETVLVLGASGIVGRITAQIAKHLGAGRVIGAARNVAALADLPLDATVPLAGADDVEVLAQAFRAAGQPNLVVDMLWGIPGLAALKAIALGGRQLNIGNSAGMDIPFSPNFMRMSNATLTGYNSGLPPASERARAYAELGKLANQGIIKVPTETMPLSRIAEIWAAQAASPNRKLCIDVTA